MFAGDDNIIVNVFELRSVVRCSTTKIAILFRDGSKQVVRFSSSLSCLDAFKTLQSKCSTIQG